MKAILIHVFDSYMLFDSFLLVILKHLPRPPSGVVDIEGCLVQSNGELT